LKGGRLTTLVPEFNGLFAWLPDGRILYAVGTPGPNQELELRVSRTDAGRMVGKGERVAKWTGSGIWDIRATSGGKRVVIMKGPYQRDVYIGDLEADGTRMKAPPRRLTLDERDDYPMAWTRDSKAVFFSSNRNGNDDIFRQDIDKDSAEALVTSTDSKTPLGVSPDGRDLFYQMQPTGPSNSPLRVMRVPVYGGPSQLVLGPTPGLHGFWCAKAPFDFCLYARDEGRKSTFFRYEIATRQSQEITRVEGAADYDVFPDGRIALRMNTQQTTIRILRPSGQQESEFTVNGWIGINHIWCSPSGKRLYLTSHSRPGGATLLSVDLQGNARVIWQQKGAPDTFGIESPDGKHLAILGGTMNMDAWLLENF
jgi:Tol biopolymer transport system component